MSTTSTTPADALAALRSLSGDQIEARIADLDAERTTLSRLLRSIRAGERARERTARRTPSREVKR